MAMKRKNLPEVIPELFEHEQFRNFRYIKRDAEIWFVGIDLCRALGYTNSRKALKGYVDPEDKRPDVTIRYVSSNGVVQNRKVTLVNESGMYMLIFGSTLPAAKRFTRWVTNEMLPSIRKYGFYGLLNGEQALQLSDKQYLKYLGGLDCFQYETYLEQLTVEQRSEHYRRLEERIDSKNMTQEEILSLSNDPYITVSRIENAPWKASVC